MGEVAGQITLDPRQVSKVLRLVVALVESGEEAEDLGGALDAHRRIGGGEALSVEGGIGGRPAAHIEGSETHLEIFAAAAARVVQQQNELIARRPNPRTLKIDRADSLDPLPLREPMQIG